MCKHDTNASRDEYQNKKWVLTSHPNGSFEPSKNSKLVCETLKISDLSADEVLISVQMLSVDAFIRTMMDEEAYHGSIKIDCVLPAIGYGTVIACGSKVKYSVGTRVAGMLGAQTNAVVKSSMVMRSFMFPGVRPSLGLGLLSLTTGMTAYVGMFSVTKSPRKGETVVVSAAAGAVGSVATQLAKITGARVIGIAGGEEKCNYLKNELGCDATIDYKDNSSTMPEKLEDTCPNGIDFFYDNVGGDILDMVLQKINPKGRIVICGAVSQYEGNLNKGKVRGPSEYLKLAERGATMVGFNVMQYMTQFIKAQFWLHWYYFRGYLTLKETVETGVESFPFALQKLFTGGHIGKMLVNVKKDD